MRTRPEGPLDEIIEEPRSGLEIMLLNSTISNAGGFIYVLMMRTRPEGSLDEIIEEARSVLEIIKHFLYWETGET